MRKAVSILIILGIMWTMTSLAHAGFRKAEWSMKPAEVMEIEGSPFYERSTLDNGNFVPTYQGSLFHQACEILYIFDRKGELVRGEYNIRYPYWDDTLAVPNARKILTILLDIYGSPVRKDEVKEKTGGWWSFWWKTETTQIYHSVVVELVLERALLLKDHPGLQNTISIYEGRLKIV